MGVKSKLIETMDTDPSDPSSLVLYEKYYNTDKNTYYTMRPLFTVEREPSFGYTGNPKVLTSLPMWSFQSDVDSIDDIWFSQVLVQMNDPADTDTMK